MTDTLLSVFAFAALFVAYGLLTRGRERTHGCDHCDDICRYESESRVRTIRFLPQ